MTNPITASRERITELTKILDLIDGQGKRAHAVHAPEDAEVKALCERIGYGAVMDSAARQWFLKDRYGAFTVGPCAATVRDIPAALLQHEATVKEEMARIVEGIKQPDDPHSPYWQLGFERAKKTAAQAIRTTKPTL